MSSADELAGLPVSYPRHSLLDDAYGLFIGIAFAATGIAILGKSGLITGGIAGMALLGSFISSYTPSVLVPAINVPFLLFALFTMGRAFTLKSVLVSFALGLGVSLVSPLLSASGINPDIGCILGGTFSMGISAWPGTTPDGWHRVGGAVDSAAVFDQCRYRATGLRCGVVHRGEPVPAS